MWELYANSPSPPPFTRELSPGIMPSGGTSGSSTGESPAQRAARSARDKARTSAARATETPDDASARLDRDRRRKAASRAVSRSAARLAPPPTPDEERDAFRARRKIIRARKVAVRERKQRSARAFNFMAEKFAPQHDDLLIAIQG